MLTERQEQQLRRASPEGQWVRRRPTTIGGLHDIACGGVQAETDVDSLLEQVLQSESANKSPIKRRAVATDDTMGMHPP